MSNQAPAATTAFLMEEQIVSANGEGPSVAVSDAGAAIATLTFGIVESVEQQSIDLSVYRSEDGETWDEQPVLVFPQRFYAGTMAMTLDLRKFPGTSFLKARWSVSRWGRGELTPRFRAYLFLSC